MNPQVHLASRSVERKSWRSVVFLAALLAGMISDGFPAIAGIDGGAGNDTIDGGPGDDLIEGGDNKDKIRGEAGSDKLRGQDGADCLIGGPRKDVLVGGPDGDRLLARDGVRDVVNGGLQFDRARVDGADDLIRVENDNFQGGCP